MTKQEILSWFDMVCSGIRCEYEVGASHRNVEIDKNTLDNMLDEYVMDVKREYENRCCNG